MASAVLTAERDSDNVLQIAMQVPDINCAACTLRIEKSLEKLSGVERVRTNLASKTVYVDVCGISEETVLSNIRQLGFSPASFERDAELDALAGETNSMLARLGVAGIGMMQVMMYAIAVYLAGDSGIEPAYEKLMQWASLAMTTPVVFYSAAVFYRNAWRDIKAGQAGMDVPVSIAILAGFCVSLVGVGSEFGEVYFDSVCMFTFLLLIGRFIELNVRRKYFNDINLSNTFVPTSARLEVTNELVNVGKLMIGARVIVRAGEVMPVDGVIRQGRADVSEMAFTGESMPLTRETGQRVLAGSECLVGDVVVEMLVEPKFFVINKMAELFRESTLYKPLFAKLADRIAKYFVAIILLLASLAGIYWYLAGAQDWFVIALTVLVVSCPCALSLATPVAYTVAITALRRFGVVVRTGEFIEKVAQINHLTFDKTGTLTQAKLTLEQVVVLESMTRAQVLEICGALEKVSRHPLAMAFKDFDTLTVDKAKSEVGLGVSGLIHDVLYRFGSASFAIGENIKEPEGEGIWLLLASDKPLAWVNLRDEVRPGSSALLQWLRSHGYGYSMLTGDSASEAQRVAELLSIDSFESRMTPLQKMSSIQQAQATSDVVMMVGDGVNDAAAMGVATASIAISPVDTIVQEAAEATLMKADISKLAGLLDYSKKVTRVIRQNIFWAVAYNLLLIPLAVAGLLEPWQAALGMSFSSLFVVLNATRLRAVALVNL